MAESLDRLFAEDCPPFIFVALPCQDYYHEFEDTFIHHVIPFVRKEFNVSSDSDHIAIGGISSGGDLANRMYFSYPTLFSHLGQHSAAIAKNDLKLWEQRMEKLRNKKHRSFYFNVGTEDFLLEIYGLIEPIIAGAGVEYQFYRSSGSHNTYYYQTIFDDIVSWYGGAVNNE